jgi:hypothetical protein
MIMSMESCLETRDLLAPGYVAAETAPYAVTFLASSHHLFVLLSFLHVLTRLMIARDFLLTGTVVHRPANSKGMPRHTWHTHWLRHWLPGAWLQILGLAVDDPLPCHRQPLPRHPPVSLWP